MQHTGAHAALVCIALLTPVSHCREDRLTTSRPIGTSTSHVDSRRSNATGSERSSFAAAREQMVHTQLVARGIHDKRVLAAMRRVPRHRFIPPNGREYAYADRPLPIGEGQTISQPYIVAYMSEALMVGPGMCVLEIGTGSGYQAAVLAELAKEVYTIEIVPSLGRRAARLLARIGYARVHARIGDGYRGWPDKAPFDRIMLTAAPPRIPEPLLDQLAVGGILVAPEGTTWQHLVRITRTATGWKRERLLGVRFVPMTGEAERLPVRHGH